MHIDKVLEKIGLSEKESKTYLANLSLGSAPISQISRKSGIKRTTTNEVIKSLQKQNLVSISAKGKRKNYIAIEPEGLHSLIQEKEHMLLSIIPELKALVQTQKNRPTIQVFEGEKGIQSLYEDTLKVKQPIYMFFDFAATPPALMKWFDDVYVQKQVQKGIDIQMISPDTDMSKERMRQPGNPAILLDMRLIPAKRYPFTVEIDIYGTKTAIISYKEHEQFGIIIDSKEIATTMKTIFKFFWDNAIV